MMSASTGRNPVLIAIAAGALLLAYSMAASADPAGRVLFVAGNVLATDTAGSTRALERGASVEEGDTIATHDGRVQLQFKDGAFLALQPETRFRVERYRHAAAGDAEDSVVLSLLKGGLRTISGLVGKKNRDDYRMDSAVATIGIRGTDYALELDSQLSGHVAEGAIEVCNGAGCILVQSGFAFSVPSFIDPPVLGERRAFLPPTPSDQAPPRAEDKAQAARKRAGAVLDAVPGRGPRFDVLPAPGATGNGKANNSAPAAAAPGPASTRPAAAPAASAPGQAKPVPPGLANKIPAVEADVVGPPGLVKKNR